MFQSIVAEAAVTVGAWYELNMLSIAGLRARSESLVLNRY